ncbi:MAG: PKD domain-containing protein, partial [Gemmatimonadota bacterium]
VWTPSGAGYTVQDLGALPGMSVTTSAGIDDQGRVVGWSSTGGAFPTAAAPFMWSQATGMVNLVSLGAPNNFPLGISPGGTVATPSGWYRLSNPASVTPLPPPPTSFLSPGSAPAVINDAGDQAFGLNTTSGQSLTYLFRLPVGGTWQLLSGAGTGHLSGAGLGSINSSLDVTGTAQSTGFVAAGPNGLAQSLASLVSPAYGTPTVGGAGRMNASGQILASVYFGTSPRLVRLTPVTPCGANCIVASVALTSQFIQDPANPGSCFQGGTMYNQSSATVTVTDEVGAPLANAQVNGRFMDDYWTSKAVTGTTNAAGVASWSSKGPCGVGSIEFLLEKATLGTRTFDRTRGLLVKSVIPSVTPPGNQPPVARFTFGCNTTTRNCSFNGSGSSDDVGVVSYSWAFGDGATGIGVNVAHVYAAAGSYPVTLTVTDGGGLTGALTKTVTVSNSTNKPPVAAWTVSCQPAPAHTCTFNGTGSRDPDGTIVAYKWTNAGGTTLSTAATFTRTFSRSMTVTWTLTVTDNGGKTGKLTKAFTVP